MALNPNTVTTFTGFLKTVYAQNLVNTVPDMFMLQNDAPFGRARRIGEQFHQAVRVKLEQGFTYSRGGTSAFALSDATPGTISKALIDGFQGVMKSAIDYETLSKALTKGKMAYGSSGDELLKNMAFSTRKRCEIDLWHGQSADGLGVIDTGGVSGAVYTISQASWAPGIYVGMEDAPIELFDSALTTQRDFNEVRKISTVDVGTRKVTVDTAHAAAAATDRLFFGGNPNTVDGQRTTAAWNSPIGLLGIAGTTSGTLFNINVSNSIWKPEAYAVGGPLTFAHVQNAAAISVTKGLDRGATVYVATEVWADLLTEQAALRRFGGQFDGRVTLKQGASALEFWSSSGKLTIKPSIYCPIGRAIVCPSGSLKRVGSSDVTFKVPGMDEPLSHVSESSAGIILFCYYNQSLFTSEPGQITNMTGITT